MSNAEPKAILKWHRRSPINFMDITPDYAERIRVRNRATRWAHEAARDGRYHARLERIRLRAAAADKVGMDAIRDGKPEVAGAWRALRDVYFKAHDRALARPR